MVPFVRFDARRWRRFWRLHLQWFWEDARLLARRTVTQFVDDACPHHAAGISFYVLFSIFPLVVLLVSLSGIVLTDPGKRDALVDELLAVLPLSADRGRQELESIVTRVSERWAASGAAGVLGLLWSASSMMGALRRALDVAWDVPNRRPFLLGKLMDLGMLLGLGALLCSSLASTLLLQVVGRLSRTVSGWLGPFGAGATAGFELLALALPFSLSFLTFLLLLRFVPSVKTRVAYVWPGALATAILFELVKHGFALYLRYFANFDALYGSLGAVVAFLFFVYLGANALLLGAELAAEWPRVLFGHYDDELDRAGAGPDGPFWRRTLLALSGLVRPAELPEHAFDPEARARRARRRAEEAARAARRAEPPP